MPTYSLGRRPPSSIPRRWRGNSFAPASSVTPNEMSFLFRVLRDAAAERPVFLRDFDEVDHYVVAPQVQLRVDVVGDALEKRLLHLDGQPCVHRDLDQHDV